MSRIMLIFGTALIALMAGALFYAARIPLEVEAPPTPQPRQLEVVTRPAFTLPDLEGVEREFVEWDGKHRLLNFWATWCAPCRREIPMLKAFQEQHREAGFQILGIAVDYPEQVTLTLNRRNSTTRSSSVSRMRWRLPRAPASSS